MAAAAPAAAAGLPGLASLAAALRPAARAPLPGASPGVGDAAGASRGRGPDHAPAPPARDHRRRRPERQHPAQPGRGGDRGAHPGRREERRRPVRRGELRARRSGRDAADAQPGLRRVRDPARPHLFRPRQCPAPGRGDHPGRLRPAAGADLRRPPEPG